MTTYHCVVPVEVSIYVCVLCAVMSELTANWQSRTDVETTKKKGSFRSHAKSIVNRI